MKDIDENILKRRTERRSRKRRGGKPGILVGMGDMKNQTLPIEPGVPESFVRACLESFQ
jgi:hypothetical protein